MSLSLSQAIRWLFVAAAGLLLLLILQPRAMAAAEARNGAQVAQTGCASCLHRVSVRVDRPGVPNATEAHFQ